jgi:nicotinate-nucleotide adenylyltransferase
VSARGCGAGRALGILGGTFNPPHLGHATLARAARTELELERILLMPARIAPHKLDEQDPGPRHRLRMCELAAEDAEAIAACGLELEREGPSYTVDTLNAIHANSPQTRLTFVLGADTACTLGSWREPRRILELADLAVAARSGSPRERVLEALAALAPDAGEDAAGSARVRFLQVPPIELSSSKVRALVAAGEPVADLVGASVAEYIERHGLYRAQQGSAR